MKKYHLLDGGTGSPVEPKIVQATVVSHQCLDAEVGAKICFMEDPVSVNNVLKRISNHFNFVLVKTGGELVKRRKSLMDVDLISNWVLIRLSGFLAYFLFTCSIWCWINEPIFPFSKSKHSYDRIASIKRMGRIVSGDFSHDIIMEMIVLLHTNF